MSKVSRILTFLAVIPAALSCTSFLEDAGTPAGEPGISDRILNTSSDAVPGSLVFFVEDASVLGSVEMSEALSAIKAATVGKVFPTTGPDLASVMDRWYAVTFDGTVGLDYAAGLLAGVSGVSKVQFNSRLHRTSDGKSRQASVSSNTAVSGKAAASGRFNDPGLALQWNYRNTGSLEIASTAVPGADINVSDAWRICGGDPRIIVAVVDECVQYDHPDLQQNMWVNTGEIPGNGIDDDGNGYTDDYSGCNFAVSTDRAGDLSYNKPGDTGHATHIAGTIAAVNNNSIGACGIAGGTGSSDGVRIMTCQIFDGMSGGDVLTCARAIR